jgi:hypothetical protein
MSDGIVYVDISDVREGTLEKLRRAPLRPDCLRRTDKKGRTPYDAFRMLDRTSDP